MKILALNCGSSSVKYALIETSLDLIEANRDRELARGLIERIGTPEMPRHEDAIRQAIAGASQIEAVGHRMVHGGEVFSGSVLMDDDLARRIETFNELAPLHNPHNLKGYHAARSLLPDVPQVAVFDTAFHQSMPPRAYLYALPYEMYERHRIRRFGFHGSSHRYVSWRYARLRGGRPQDYKLITCHLGNGCSIAAVDRWRSIDTSMGFTPLEGLVMGTRTGDIDAAAVLHLMAARGMNIEEADVLLNQRSGLLGLSGLTNDMRTLIEAAGVGNGRARLAIDVFCYRVKKYIGAYYAALNGADAVIFTGGIGENAAAIRAQICDGLTALGLEIDAARNAAAAGVEMDISAGGAATRVWVIPTQEELVIARETLRTLVKAEPI